MCMEVTYKCRLLGLSLPLAFAVFAHMQRSRQRDCYTCSVDCDVRLQWTSFFMSLGLEDC